MNRHLSPFGRLRAMLDRRLYHILLSMRMIAPRPKATDIPRSNTQRAVRVSPALAAPYGAEQPTPRAVQALSRHLHASIMATVTGSRGTLDIDHHGRVLRRQPPDTYPEVSQFDTTEHAVWSHSARHAHMGHIDILDIGYWTPDGTTYVPADPLHRQFTAGLMCPHCHTLTAPGHDHVCA